MGWDSDLLQLQTLERREVQERLRAAETVVSDVIGRWERITSNRGVRRRWFDGDYTRPPACARSVPSDRLCWVIDVGRLLRQIDLDIGPGASLVMRARLAKPPLPWEEIARATRMPVSVCKRLHELAVFRVRLGLEPFGEVAAHWDAA